MNIIFMGTPDFSAIVFEKLVEKFPVTAVVTAMDKPTGRKMEITPCPLKVSAIKRGIKVLQYNKVSKEGIEDIRRLAPDLVITCAFGQILSTEFLEIPRLGVINVHASLLPLYRGASPIQAALLNGDRKTGITIMQTVKEVDAGDVLLQEEIAIDDDDYADTLFDKLAVLGGECIVKAVELIESGNAVFIPQNHSLATHCNKINKEDGLISFERTFAELHSFVHGMTPWPSAYTYLDGKQLKVIEVQEADAVGEPGRVIFADRKNGLVIGCKGGSVRLVTIQPSGKGKTDDVSYINGHNVTIGGKLGEELYQ